MDRTRVISLIHSSFLKKTFFSLSLKYHELEGLGPVTFLSLSPFCSLTKLLGDEDDHHLSQGVTVAEY